MKNFLMGSAILCAVFFAIPVWSHHAAEGIVTDEIWQMVDELLGDADSPHLNLDFDDMGMPLLVTSFEVYTEDVDYYVSAVTVGLDDLQRGESTIFMVTEEIEAGVTEIRIYEPIGSGRSQAIPEAVY